jgi:LDH2 family malate/lactate/ureidoglycolate dehydrogenase
VTALPDDSRVVAAGWLRSTISAVLSGTGVPETSAAAVAELLVEADLSGVDSHGTHLLPMYVRRILEGHIVPDAPMSVLRDEGSSVWLDAGLGLGQVAGLRAVEEATSRAARFGSATVAVREATHLGALGAYTRRVAEAGHLALCFQNGPTIVPPFGGVTPLFSTNPISYAVPTAEEPTIVYDVATTAVAGNKLLLAKKRGDPTIPEGWANDELGRPTTDTDAASVWNLQWFGAHKGYGIGFLVEVLAGVLAGSSFGLTERTGSELTGRERVAKGFVLLAIDPARFGGTDAFRRDMDTLIRDVHHAARAEGAPPILVPGELEHDRRMQRERDGIVLPAAILREVEALAARHGGARAPAGSGAPAGSPGS